nr:DUF4232 domain-containing protein [Pseudofrankia asymbiotica]
MATPAARISATEPPVDGVRITQLTVPSGTPNPGSGPGGSPGRVDPFPAHDSGISASYEVTNDNAEALTYTILFDFTTDAGEVMANTYETVRAVGPGAIVRGTVRLGVLAPGASPVTRVKVAEVTSVPAAEAPPAPGECPSSGIRLTAGDVDAAMGLRAVSLDLENCGTRDYPLEGYPLLELLDDDRSRVDGVQIVHGSGGIATVPGFDEPAGPLVLKPGESARSALMWRNTTELGPAPVNIPYVRVRAQQGADPVIVTLHLDLGTTGRLAAQPWAHPPT